MRPQVLVQRGEVLLPQETPTMEVDEEVGECDQRRFVGSVFKGERVGVFARGTIYLGNSEVLPEKLNYLEERTHLMDPFCPC